jgi:hypothetical protein
VRYRSLYAMTQRCGREERTARKKEGANKWKTWQLRLVASSD